MLLEFDADQRLWQETVRDAVTKQCPPSLVRERRRKRCRSGTAVADLHRCRLDGADRPGARGRAGDRAGGAWPRHRSDAVSGDADPVRAAGRRPIRPAARGHRDLQRRHRASRRRRLGARRHGASCPRRRPRASGSRSSPRPGSSSSTPATRPSGAAQVFDPVLHIAEVSFAGVHVPDTDRVHVDAEKARHVALTGMAITTVGACQRILDLVLEHVKQRQQFGVAIGSFQAVQHKAVDMHVATERARALSYFAALTISADDPRRRLAAAMAKAAAGECQAVVFRHGLQLFGAMGFTWENDLAVRAQAGQGRRTAARRRGGASRDHRGGIQCS